jgi:cell cycle serine/threonine-protein kinase CDC5/MSD2
MAPELVEGPEHSFEVDSWAIGVIIFALLTGKPPFESDDEDKTYKKIAICNYIWPSDTKSQHQCSEAVKLVESIFKKNPLRRPLP